VIPCGTGVLVAVRLVAVTLLVRDLLCDCEQRFGAGGANVLHSRTTREATQRRSTEQYYNCMHRSADPTSCQLPTARGVAKGGGLGTPPQSNPTKNY